MAFKKFINDSKTITAEMIEGLAMVMEDYIDIEDTMVIRKGFDKEEPKVNIITLGGTGHEPSSMGFCGKGWECIKVLGDIFAAPGPQAVFEGIKRADKGKGVLMYVGNHAGDVMSAKMAYKMAKKAGINVEMINFHDDVSSFPREERENRRGMIASLALGKILGAACERGLSLEEVKKIGEKVIENVASIAAATRSATHPETGQFLSHIEEGKMIVGMGQHGEGNGLCCDTPTSYETVKIMADLIIKDLELKAGDRVSVTLNGVGSTTYMELMILYKDTVKYLKEMGIEVAFKIVGEYLTTQEQAGIQLSFIKLDDELEELLKAPCRTAFMTRM